MKVKSDFVTNSSSTCYVIAIPKNLKVKTENKTVNKFIKILLDELKTEGVVEVGMCAEYKFTIPEDDDGDIMDGLFDAIHDKILSEEFVIFSEDFGPDYPDKIINLNTDRFRDRINKFNEAINEGKK